MAAPASAAAASVLDADTARAFGALLARFSAQRAAAALHARSVAAAAAAPAPGVPPPPPPPQASPATGTAPAPASVPAPPPPLLDWSRVRPPVLGGKVLDYESLEAVPPDEPLHQELLRKVAIVKLNGGLGSSMGLQGPKGALPVRGPATFLDMTVRQVEFLNARFGVDVPLVLMNSFRTHESTVKVLRKYASHNVSVTCFVQGCFPRLDPDTLLPLPGLPYSGSPDDSGFYPPGHGDVFRALDRSGVLDALLARSVEYVFISNVDNLGATADLRLIQHLVNNEVEFAMEVADRTRGDVQGGVLVEYVSGGSGGGASAAASGAAAVAAPASGGAGAGSGGAGAAGAAGAADAPTSVVKLVELAQVPPERLADFSRLRPFSFFNTNNLWVNLKAVKALVSADALQSPVLVTERVVPGLGHVLELETAAGAAIEFFRRAVGVRVPRSRFLPVKSTGDLLAVTSNLYELRHGSLVVSPRREAASPPVIKLGPEFAHLAGYSERLPHLPDCVDLEHLTVSGNVFFGEGVVLKGTVIIVAENGARIDVPDGAVLQDKVISGALRIVDH